jgi:hypothetical protein
MSDRPGRNGETTTRQLLMDFRHTAVLGMAQRADQGDDIEAKLVLGERQPPLGLGPLGLLKLGTGWGDTAPDCEREASHIGQGRDRAIVVRGCRHGVAAGGAVA